MYGVNNQHHSARHIDTPLLTIYRVLRARVSLRTTKGSWHDTCVISRLYTDKRGEATSRKRGCDSWSVRRDHLCERARHSRGSSTYPISLALIYDVWRTQRTYFERLKCCWFGGDAFVRNRDRSGVRNYNPHQLILALKILER